jgi:CRP-like cAMP-binding protein
MLDALKQYVSRYVALSNEEFAFLADKLVIRNFDKKQQLVKVGEVETYLNFIIKGLARKYFYKGKAEVITQIAREGEMISSSASFLSGIASPYIVETLEPATVFSISKKHLEKLYESNPRIERIGRLVITHLFLQKEEWEHECIRMDTRERFLHFVENNPDLLQRVPQKYLASYLNMKPETFSRLKHLLHKRPAPAEPARRPSGVRQNIHPVPGKKERK